MKKFEERDIEALADLWGKDQRANEFSEKVEYGNPSEYSLPEANTEKQHIVLLQARLQDLQQQINAQPKITVFPKWLGTGALAAAALLCLLLATNLFIIVEGKKEIEAIQQNVSGNNLLREVFDINSELKKFRALFEYQLQALVDSGTISEEARVELNASLESLDFKPIAKQTAEPDDQDS